VLAARGFDLAFISRMFPAFVLEREEHPTLLGNPLSGIGELLGNVYMLVYTTRGKSCRLITAWEAEPEHRLRWYEFR
jgi:hypothetical protein